MADVEDYFALLEQAESLPTGRRVPVLEQAVRLADDLGYEDLGGQSRLRLVSAYERSTSGPKIFTPFTWLLQRYEEKRAWFDEDMRLTFLWQLKWMTGNLFSYPEVPLARIEENLATMYRIYAEAGEGLNPVHGSAFLLARHVRGVRGAGRVRGLARVRSDPPQRLHRLRAVDPRPVPSPAGSVAGGAGLRRAGAGERQDLQ